MRKVRHLQASHRARGVSRTSAYRVSERAERNEPMPEHDLDRVPAARGGKSRRELSAGSGHGARWTEIRAFRSFGPRTDCSSTVPIPLTYTLWSSTSGSSGVHSFVSSPFRVVT